MHIILVQEMINCIDYIEIHTWASCVVEILVRAVICLKADSILCKMSRDRLLASAFF